MSTLVLQNGAVQLRDLLTAASISGDASGVTADTHLLRAGVLDSMGIVELAAAIESAYGIRLPPAEVNPQNFRTLTSIANMIARHGKDTHEQDR